MEFAVIAYSLLAFILVVLIAGPWGIKAEEKQRRLNMIGDSPKNAAFLELNRSFYDRFLGKYKKKFSKTLEKMMPKQRNEKKTKQTEAIKKQLRLAGLFVEPSDFQFVKTVVLVIAVVVALLVVIILDINVLYKLLILCVGLAIGIAGPTFFLKSMASKHQFGIKRQLPDALDMISVCIESGLSFDSALLKVAEKLHGPFIDELMLVHREMSMGRTRRQALQGMCNATTVEELKTFASALIQAEQMGIPINNVMKAQSDQLRVQRSQEAKAKGMKASIKMLIPMLLFIFPVVFIIIMGPTVMNIIEMF